MGKYSERTLKYLFGTASQCAHPGCAQPLIDRERGRLTVLVEIAHIRSEKPNGPRYDPDYPQEEINSFDNLLLLCPPHHKPVDDNASDYAVAELEQWKEAQVAQPGQVLSGTDVATIVEQVTIASMTVTGANAVVGLARTTRVFVETAKRERGRALQAALAWEATNERVRTQHLMWDMDGERLYASPSRQETQQHRAQVSAALEAAVAALIPLADAVHGELQAVRTIHSGLVDWCDWVERAVRVVIEAASRWPEPPPFRDDESFPAAIADLERSVESLAAGWRGEDVDNPPPAPVQAADEDPQDRRYAQHAALLESARPWARVMHRPFEESLYQALVAATKVALTLPPTVAFLAVDINATASLAAAVARNADDATARHLIAEAAQLAPVAIPAALLHNLAKVYHKADREDLHDLAKYGAIAALAAESWNSRQAWVDNEMCARHVLDLTALVTSDDELRHTLESALGGNAELLGPMLLGCASWIETRDVDDWSLTGVKRTYERLPDWFPVTNIVAQIEVQYPDVVPADEWQADKIPDEIHRLASRVLHLASL